MHYYQFNIGDYASHTSRLTPIEDLAYRRIMDLYYLNEQPLIGSALDVSRELGLLEYTEQVEYVLSKFFTKTETGFSQKRIDLEIKKYKNNAINKKKAGKASAKARRVKASSKVTGVEQVLNTCSTGEQQNINHKPITNNQLKDIKDIVVRPPKFNFKTELLALGVDAKKVDDWMAVRKSKKAVNTETALKGFLTQVDKANLTVSEAVTIAAESSWSGFKASWYANIKTDENKNADILAVSSESNWHEEDLGL